jgi:microcin C transport system substrate-binding protein
MARDKASPFQTAVLLAILATAAVLPSWCASALAGEAPRRHALSLIGEPASPPDFPHFDWVNPAAPKGGAVRIRGIGSFDTLNRYANRGEAALGLNLVNTSLMMTSLDEPSTEYGLVAAWVSHPDDFGSVTFGLRPEARFHDGQPITVEDVIFTLNAIKAASPHFALYYKNVVKAERSGEHEVTFTFDSTGNRELPQIVGSMPVLPRHFWQGKNDKGQPRDVARGTLDIPLGAGPYRIKSVDPGRLVTYERVPDWWAKDLPVTRGQWNFDEITFVYYRDRTPAFEAFKIGETDFWPESSAKGWATGYDIDAVRRGLIRKETIESRQIAGMQGFAFNLRRPKFQDPRVRQAFNLAFNFEWANRNMFYDQYLRSGSYFENSELKASGLPQGGELAILETVRNGVPPEVFTAEYRNPVNNAPEDLRRNMQRAARLLAEAGWSHGRQGLTNSAGDVLAAEFLLVQPDFERLVLAYKAELEKLGIRVEIRTVDSAQYRRRLDTFDFDVVVARFPQSLSPGNEQREFWGSAAATKEGSQNIIGIRSPAIDTLVERLIFATDRTDLIAATRALDRVLLWNHFVVPQFYIAHDRIASWSKFGRPARLPRQAGPLNSFLQVWWWDEQAVRKLQESRAR